MAATIEMESYLSPPETIGAAQCACGQEDTNSIKEKTATIALCLWHWYHKKLVGLMEWLPQWVERLEQISGQQNVKLLFEKLQQNLISTPVLAHPDFSQRFILDTDVSNTSGLGAVLSQVDRSRSLHMRADCWARQRGDGAWWEESCWSWLRSLDIFVPIHGPKIPSLYRSWFPNMILQSFRELEGQLACWLEKLQELDFVMQMCCHKFHANNVVDFVTVIVWLKTVLRLQSLPCRAQRSQEYRIFEQSR